MRAQSGSGRICYPLEYAIPECLAGGGLRRSGGLVRPASGFTGRPLKVVRPPPVQQGDRCLEITAT
jgi:hypothetical protein